MKRTYPTRAGTGGTKQRMETRLELRKTARTALHKVNPAGAKVAKRVAKVRGLTSAKGLYFHGGELTLAVYNRRNPFPAKTHAEMLRRRDPQPQEKSA